MHVDAKALGIEAPDAEPRATAHIDGIIEMVQTLIEKGYAYAADNGDVYYSVRKFEGYGKLSGKVLDDLEAGARIEIDEVKQDPLDFVLWKHAKADEPHWDSPWGIGRPGWHIECSVMSTCCLGNNFDIHGGGPDLKFPHHENEIAQSECCHGAPMAKYWMHNGLLRAEAKGKVGGRSDREEADNASTAEDAAAAKISRSKGGGGLHKLVNTHGGESMRFFLLRTHYRSTVVFGEDGLADAANSLDAFHRLFATEIGGTSTATDFLRLDVKRKFT